jgi:NAD(P)-dependent dehydrogenase (short-subunit alcohol dehydrogenase family)
MSEKIILITGVSSGFGAAIADEAFRQGWRVVGTVRSEQARIAFEAKCPGQSIGRLLDVTEGARVSQVITEVETAVGPICALVNNAGYGLVGPIEECPMDEIRKQFECNVFGAIAVLQGVLPFMRRRRTGRILNITSMGGIITFPGVGIYNASKFAFEGVSDVLGKEVREFGIFVTAVEPGMFRTDWYGRSQRKAPQAINDYDNQREELKKLDSMAYGDLARATEVILTVLDDPDPPTHLPLGADAFKLIEERLDTLKAEIAARRSLSESPSYQAV